MFSNLHRVQHSDNTRVIKKTMKSYKYVENEKETIF